MDKENKVGGANEEISFDSDAEDLLRDLESDEDDSEYSGGDASTSGEVTATQSLANMIASSVNLESLTSGCYRAAESAVDAQEASDLAQEEDDATADTLPMPGREVEMASRGQETSKKPEEEGAKSEGSRSESSSKSEEVEASSERAVHDSDSEEVEKSGPRQSLKRPPIPPKMPAGVRVLREGETAYTQEAINDMLPGGKNDDGRDLNYKFTDNSWYAQIFNEDYLRTVPKSSPRQTRREAKFIVDRMGIERGARVLDLCCGFGRHTIELAAQGFDMVGLDLSMVMLKRALSDAQERGQAIKFVHGDMRKLSFNSIFDAIYNVQTSFGYFDDQSNFKVLQGMFRALKQGGVLMLETINRDFLINDLPLRLWWKGKECTLLEEIDMEPLSGLLKVQRSFVFDDSSRAPWEQKIQIRLYTATEMRALLTRAGFDIVELSGDYSLPGAYFGASSPRNIFVAERPRR